MINLQKGFYFSNLANFQVLGQKFVIFFLENSKHHKVILKLTDLWIIDKSWIENKELENEKNSYKIENNES